jgi:enoyl-CoA hydratase/carnithine racemase
MSDAARLRLTIRDERGGQRLTPALVERLRAALESERGATLVTLEGDSKTFCEGMDLASFASDVGAVTAELERFAGLLSDITRRPSPVIALVCGAAMGGGVGLAAAADLVLATPQATFGLPETLFGLVPAMVYPVLARRVGPVRARWMALGAPTISAAEAWRIGLVDGVVDDLESALARHARHLARLDARAVAEVKAMSAVYEDATAAYHAHATAAFRRLLYTTDTRGRIERFLSGGTPWPEGGAT